MKLWIILIACGLLMLFGIFFPVAKEETVYRFNKTRLANTVLFDEPQAASSAEKPAGSWEMKPAVMTPVSLEFSLLIPKIGVNSLVFPGIDSGSEADYLPVLKKGVAQALGSSFPDEQGIVYLFAHSTDSFWHVRDYNAVFYLLPKLQKEDKVYIYYKQKKYIYKVVDKKIIDQDKINDELRVLSGNNLVLQTCWPLGTTLKRLFVIAIPIKSGEAIPSRLPRPDFIGPRNDK